VLVAVVKWSTPRLMRSIFIDVKTPQSSEFSCERHSGYSISYSRLGLRLLLASSVNHCRLVSVPRSCCDPKES